MTPPNHAKQASPTGRNHVHVWLPGFRETKGGIQTFLESFVSGVVDVLNDRRVSIFVKNDRHCPADGRATCQAFGRFPSGPLRTLFFSLALVVAAVWQKPGLIIVGHANFCPVAAWCKRLLGIPFWVVTYGLDVWEDNGARLAGALRQAEGLLTISRFTRDHLVQRHGIDPARVLLLPVTFDPVTFQQAAKDPALLRRFGLDADSKIILTICRLAKVEQYKGYDRILEAMPEILRRVPRAHYLLGGDGDDADRLRQKVKDLGLESHVTLTGFIPPTAIASYYHLCDVFAMPSKLEGFGIVYLEALACGKPVLAGNRDGAMDALLDGELGVLVDPEDTAGIAVALTAVLTGEHPHPLLGRAAELRRRVIDAYGPESFFVVLARCLHRMVPTGVKVSANQPSSSASS